MPNNRTLTAANSIVTISVENLFPTPLRIQGFANDQMFSSEAVQSIESSMGVDGRLSAGWIPVSTVMTLTLQADSQSNDFFEQWASAQETVRELYIATGQIVVPSLNRKYAMTRGFLRSVMRFPTATKTMQPRPWSIEWESVSPAPSLGQFGAGI